MIYKEKELDKWVECFSKKVNVSTNTIRADITRKTDLTLVRG